MEPDIHFGFLYVAEAGRAPGFGTGGPHRHLLPRKGPRVRSNQSYLHRFPSSAPLFSEPALGILLRGVVRL